MGKAENVKVGVRIRPLNSSEKQRGDAVVWRITNEHISEIPKAEGPGAEHHHHV